MRQVRLRQQEVANERAKQAAKEAHLRSILAEEGYGPDSSRLSFPMPCAPQIMVNGVFPDKAKVFKSAVYPALIEFNVENVVTKNCFRQSTMDGHHPATKKRGVTRDQSSSPLGTTTSSRHDIPQLKSYRVLMKTGDDLRQDQLVMMMTKLMFESEIILELIINFKR